MTVKEFQALPATIARADASRCLLCGNRIARGTSIKDGSLYEKVESGCMEVAALIFEPGQTVGFGLRKQFLDHLASLPTE